MKPAKTSAVVLSNIVQITQIFDELPNNVDEHFNNQLKTNGFYDHSLAKIPTNETDFPMMFFWHKSCQTS